ncbi:MAG: SP_1767 family glycosyltransferase [Lachnospiraceae bacterium]|nr:SP_1767 family glycosyltransferase [Lachnospiraceae bacterium]
MKKKIYIYGIGAGYQIAQKCLQEDNICVVGYVDANATKYPNGVKGTSVITVEQLDSSDDFDFIVITIMKYENVCNDLIKMGIEKEKIINFFSLTDACESRYWGVLERNSWRMEVLTFLYDNEVKPFLNNVKYELLDEVKRGEIQIPQVASVEETVQAICEHKKSICRFGDGEFELVQLHKRAKFQEVNEKLAIRLKEILQSRDENILVAIADNYGTLKHYTEKAQGDIRCYLTNEIREQHYSLLDMNRKYYNAYFTRPYIIYQDKEKAGERFAQIKQIWKTQDVLIVEGEKTRIGVGNDLMSDAKSVQRIIAPSENAFSVYDNILESVRKHGNNKLILIALGPTATVLAYDLAKDGYWAIDIGHIDIEYEWYKRKVLDRCIIQYKYVNEIAHGEHVVDNEEFEKYREKYEREIVERIICCN